MMRVAAVQMRSGINRGENLAAAERLIREAASDGAQLVSTPEMTTALDRNRQQLLDTLSEPAPDAEDFFCALSRELGIVLHIGSMPVPGEKPEMLRNRGLVIDEGDVLARYDKVHLFDVDLPTGESWKESKVYESGDEAAVVRARGAMLGLTICYDLRFPALYRRLAQAGAEILLVPAAFTVPTGEAHWRPLLQARAIETGSFVIAAAQGGEHEDGRVTYGHSLIIDPWGAVLDECTGDEPGVAFADIDLAKAKDIRTRIPSLQLDRNPAVRIYNVS